MITYEELLDRDVNWALQEGSMHFENDSSVHRALKKITRRLEELGVPYAVAGAMAMFFHGYRRFSEDIDILVNRQGIKEIHDKLEGLGYVPPFAGSKNLRDSETGVRIDFMISGDYPGDGKPKPVVFPDPVDAQIQIDGMSFLPLPRLMELKLASGMTNPRRGKDLVDVQELIAVLHLPQGLVNELNSYVQEKYRELWKAVQDYPEEK